MNMQNYNSYFDTHAHLFNKKVLCIVDDILKKAKNLNFKGIVCICETEIEADFFLRYYKFYDFLYCATGVHPHNAEIFNKQILLNLYNKLYSTGKLLAIGETGLDFYYNFSNKKAQIDCFLEHIEFAKKYSLPLIIHLRNSYEEGYNIIKENKVTNGVVHCFTENYTSAEKIISLGLYIGFTGIITFKNNKMIEDTIKKIDVNKIVIETDTPYLSPEPLRGKVNTPLNLIYILQKLSEIKNIKVDEMKNILLKNSMNLFNIKT